MYFDILIINLKKEIEADYRFDKNVTDYIRYTCIPNKFSRSSHANVNIIIVNIILILLCRYYSDKLEKYAIDGQ